MTERWSDLESRWKERDEHYIVSITSHRIGQAGRRARRFLSPAERDAVMAWRQQEVEMLEPSDRESASLRLSEWERAG